MTPSQRNVAELLVACLENEGVEYVFGLPGEENLQVIDALADSSIRFVPLSSARSSSSRARRPGTSSSTSPPILSSALRRRRDNSISNDHATCGLDSTRFRSEFGYRPPEWPAMVDELAQQLRGVHG